MATKNNGTVQHGSRVLTIGSASGGTGGTAYVADNFNVTRPTKTIERTNELDAPSGQVTYETFVTGSATLQLAADTTKAPLLGHEFTVTGLLPDSGSPSAPTAEIFYLSEVGHVETNNGEKKVNVSFRKVVS